MSKKRKSTREKDITSQFLAGNLDVDRLDGQQRFNKRSKFHQQNKTARTTEQRVIDNIDVAKLPLARVMQVYSLYVDLLYEGKLILGFIRKTLHKTSDTSVVVGDWIRFSPIDADTREQLPGIILGRQPEAVIQTIEPRKSLLTRSDSFKAIEQHPIVANASQMLIVASVAYPTVKWGLIDRMLIAAQAGGLKPILCLNKVDVAEEFPGELDFAREALAHYASMNIEVIETSVELKVGIDTVRDRLKDQITVLAGHSGVGKSSLINAVQSSLDLRVGEISNFNQKGRHTTTSARIYPLDVGGDVIDTPGVKLFGLWNVTKENLRDFFPDLQDESAPEWRQDSFSRIESSLPD